MIFIGLFGILISVGAYWIAYPGAAPGNWKLYTACLTLHLVLTLAYWQYTFQNPADSHLYFADTLGWSRHSFQLGTISIVKLMHWARGLFGGSYLDYFLLFQSFGMIGIALIFRVLQEVTSDLNQPITFPMAFVLFLPGLHFWTSAIGKDPLLFMGVALSAWAMMRLEKRFLSLILALAIMTLVRPHIAAIAAVAVMATLLFDLRTRIAYKVPMATILIAVLFIVLQGMRQTFGMTSLDPASVSDFIASKQEYGLKTGGIQELIFPLKVLSLLFRPFFFDAKGFLGIVVSFENAVLLAVFGTFVRFLPKLLTLARSMAYVRYCLIFSLVLILLLSAVTHNIGLGLRQKYMVMPAILILYLTLIAYRRALKAQGSDDAWQASPTTSYVAQPPR